MGAPFDSCRRADLACESQLSAAHANAPARADTGAGAKPRAPSLHLPAQDEMEFDGEEHKDEDTEEVLTLEVDPIPEISDLPIHVVPVRNVWEMPRIWDLDAISK